MSLHFLLRPCSFRSSKRRECGLHMELPNFLSYYTSALATVTPNYTIQWSQKGTVVLSSPTPLSLCNHIKEWEKLLHISSRFSVPEVLWLEVSCQYKVARWIRLAKRLGKGKCKILQTWILHFTSIWGNMNIFQVCVWVGYLVSN